jgi:hypothetical protein
VGGKDAVVNSEFDGRIGTQSGDRVGLVFGIGFEDNDANRWVTAEEGDSGGASVGLGGGDGVVAIGDQVAVRNGCAERAGGLLGGCGYARGQRGGESQRLREYPQQTVRGQLI